jgi:DNA-directed RNA polymerase II subunit RPB1
MQNGDNVLFNRQPSLHKMSIMGHRVRVLPYSTFRLNLSVTTPYNADFDGDEMNMHLPQSLETKAEIAEIMYVNKQIVSPQSNRPVMGIVQDSLIGVKLFTHRDTFITLDALMNLMMWISDFDKEIPMPAILKPKPLWTGKQIFSLILPQINLIRYTSNHDEKTADTMNKFDTKVLIEKGELIMGIVCKRTVGNSSGGLIHCVFNEYGPDKTMWFLNHTQRVINQWLLLSGFSVGVSDIICDQKTNDKIRQTMNEAKEKVKDILVEAQKGNLECQPGKSMVESFESKVNASLNDARDTAGRHVQASLKSNNHLKNMVIAGSKGNVTNISQIIACVGQQNVEGKRIPFYFDKRTLPHFTKDDYGPESRGFVENSYLSGLTPQEFFFHAMGGREGLIDTAVKTSETGYIQRRLVKALEDVMVKYDGTVRNSLGHIVQFLYGEDGMAGELIEDQRIDILLMDNDKMRQKFLFLEDDFPEVLGPELERYMEKELVEEIIYSEDFPDIKMRLEEEYKKIVDDRNMMREFIFKTGDDKQHFPVNIPRIIWNAKKNFGITNQTKSNLHPKEIFIKKEELKQKLILVKGKDRLSMEAQDNSTILFNIIINTNLSCKRVIQHERLTSKAFDWVLGEIESRFNQSIVRPGEMVGSIAAQSIGEPSTQMTLNTFHFAGVSSKNVTLGVPRLKEVINVAKKLKTPSMTIFLKKDFSHQELHAKKLQTIIEHTTMMNIITSSEIFYDPNPEETIIIEDEEMVSLHSQLNYQGDQKKIDSMSPWVLRMELDANSLIDRNVNYLNLALYDLYN